MIKYFLQHRTVLIFFPVIVRTGSTVKVISFCWRRESDTDIAEMQMFAKRRGISSRALKACKIDERRLRER